MQNWTVGQLSEKAGVSESYIRRLIRQKKIKAEKANFGWIIPLWAAKKWLANRGIEIEDESRIEELERMTKNLTIDSPYKRGFADALRMASHYLKTGRHDLLPKGVAEELI